MRSRPSSARTRAVKRGVAASVIAIVAVAASVSCSSSPDQKLATSVSDPVTSAGVDTPTTAPAKAATPACAALATFQLLNYSIGLIDAKKERNKRDEAIVALEAAGAEAAGKNPELLSSIRIVILSHKARFDDQPPPTPPPGDPTLEEAANKLFAYSAEHC